LKDYFELVIINTESLLLMSIFLEVLA